MPRNGPGVYSLPANTAAVSGQPISSAKFNSLTSDLEADANFARPVVAGGTGAETVEEARDNLGVDQALSYSTKSGSYTALATDNNGIIRFSAAATLSLTAAATLGADWHVSVIADGGTLVIDPNGSETINGAATLVLAQDTATQIVCDGSNFYTVGAAPMAEPASPGILINYLSGYTLSNNGTDATNDIDIAAGSCTNGTNTHFITLTSSMTKRLDALWTVGTNQGGLDTGSVADGVYHVFAIKRPDTGVVDVLFSASYAAPTMPSNYTLRRRLGSIIRASGAILVFSQNGDEFLLDVPVRDVNATQGSTATSYALTVPTGIKVNALIRARAQNASAWVMIISSLDVADAAPSSVSSPGGTLRGENGQADLQTFDIRTNTSGQVRARSTTNSTDLVIVTYGWIDGRGK